MHIISFKNNIWFGLTSKFEGMMSLLKKLSEYMNPQIEAEAGQKIFLELLKMKKLNIYLTIM